MSSNHVDNAINALSTCSGSNINLLRNDTRTSNSNASILTSVNNGNYVFVSEVNDTMPTNAELYVVSNSVSDESGNEADAIVGWNELGLNGTGSNVFESQVENYSGDYAFRIEANDTPVLNCGINTTVTTEAQSIYRFGWAWRHIGTGGTWKLVYDGKSPSIFDELRSVVEWVFAQNVTIIAACGNNGQDGVSGSSIESPSVYQEVISVAAIDELGIPYSFSGRGPMINRTIKPDISAPGFYSNGHVTLYGTSFAAPVVTAAAAISTPITLAIANFRLSTPKR